MNKMPAGIFAAAVLVLGLTALPLAPSEAAAPDTATPMVLDRSGDSLSVRVQWSPAPRAEWYVVEVGDDAGEWSRSVEADASPAVLWAIMGDEATDAYACVTAWNRHPVRGPQEGGSRCVDWTIPGDLAAPGQPGEVQVHPDTLDVAMRHVGPPGAGTTALGLNELWMQPTGYAGSLDLYCVDLPDGRRGWLEAQVAADWTEVRSVPSPGFWPEEGCDMSTVIAEQSGDYRVEVVGEPPGVRTLTAWPGETPVVLREGPILMEVTRVGGG